MPELEGVLSLRQQRERLCEPGVVPPEGRRQLPEHRPQLPGLHERSDPRVEELDARGQVTEPLHVRDVAAHLDRKDEVVRCLVDPALHGLHRRQPVEAGVHLDAVEVARIELEPAPRRAALGIEDAVAPAVVVPARAAYEVSASPSIRHRSLVPAATTRERPTRSRGAPLKGGSSKRSIARPTSRTSSWPAAMSTERAGLSEQTPSTRPAARWQSESASEPMIRRRVAIPVIAAALSETSAVVVASKERISIRSLGKTVPSGRPFSCAPPPRLAVHSSPEPKS